jgi:hypothetical protein
MITGSFRRSSACLLTGWLMSTLIPSVAFAQSNFDGTWKLDLSTVSASMPKGPFVWLVRDSVYECRSCTPPIRAQADGRDQPTPGQPYDSISVAIIDRRTIRVVEKKNTQIVSEETFTVLADGETATDETTNWKETLRRTAQAPPGSHPISGTWQPIKLESASDRGLLVTFRLNGEELRMSRPTGQSYTATLDGTDARYNGEPRFNGVSVKRIDANTIEETDKFNDKVLVISRMTLSVDGNGMTILVRDLESATMGRFTASRQ